MTQITDGGVYESAANVPRSLVLRMSFFMSWSCLVQSNHGQLKEGWDSTEASGTSTWMSLYRRRQMTARPIETRTGLLLSLLLVQEFRFVSTVVSVFVSVLERDTAGVCESSSRRELASQSEERSEQRSCVHVFVCACVCCSRERLSLLGR